MYRAAMIMLLFGFAAGAQEFTRGVGVYPGDPKQDSAPSLVSGGTTYRNLAFRRPAYQSSAYDYNLTAQLVTDGITDTKLPRWIASSWSFGGPFAKHEREWLFDDNPVTGPDLRGPRPWVQVELRGGEEPFEIDRIDVDARAQGASSPDWTIVITASDDGRTWTEAGRAKGVNVQGEPYVPGWTRVPFTAPVHSRMYRVTFDSPSVRQWHASSLRFFREGRRIPVGGPFNFTSAWKSAGLSTEWVSVDLGAASTFDRVTLHWIRRAAEGSIEASDDGAHWRTIQPLSAAHDIQLAKPERARYVRVLMTRPSSADGYILSELEVWGRGGLVPKPRAARTVQANGRLDLAGGAWRLQRDSLVSASGDDLSKPGFADADWLVATVPATTLSSYWNAGALPNPNFGDNINTISDSFFYADFWYRNEFAAPPAGAGKHVWLNFDGINWKADVFLNGEKIGRIEGGFTRARFDVTNRLRVGRQNAIAIRVEKNANPGSVKEKTFTDPDKNGGVLGADNPTYHATIGWDWIPTVRGRDTGIWNDVYLTTTGPVSLENPFVQTRLPLPDTSRADVSIEVTLRNHDAQPVSGSLRGRYGDRTFNTPVTIDPSAEKTVTAALQLPNPKLWWPAGYGEPNLYDVELTFETSPGAVSDSKSFKSGVRQFAYREGSALRMWINGRRFIPRGGNWGFGESMLRYRAREYDVAVRYHRDMNFTMIRNWVGQIGDDELYEACDRHGIVVWQDFWLANPWDGPDPDNDAMFLANARDMILRIRNHPSLGLYCGRNEGYPPPVLESGLRKLLAEDHPDLHYIPSSADDVVSGHGPYQAMPLDFYFTGRATPKLHSELGMPNILTYDSLRDTMPESAMWPQGDMWGLHDFSMRGAQGGASFRSRIDISYGGADNAREWTQLAQFVNYEGYRAMFEAQGKNRMGLLIWMSHPTWPSFVWQTYDYFFEPTAAYFACKKASEPLHIEWNPVTGNVEVVNYSAGNQRGLTAQVQVLNLDGAVKWEKSAPLDSDEDSLVAPVHIEYPPDLTPVHFLRLRLIRGGRVVSDNFYWRGTELYNYRALRELPKVKVEATTKVDRTGSQWLLTTELHNGSKTPVLMVRLKPVRERSGDRILPALISDNFIALMPGERRAITIQIDNADTRGEQPRVVVEGFNVE
jgi:hypothetical protein